MPLGDCDLIAVTNTYLLLVRTYHANVAKMKEVQKTP